MKLEKAVFDKNSQTEILLISAKEQPNFSKYYQTENSRFHLLPPGITRDRAASANALAKREQLRLHYQIKENDKIILLVGSGFKTKGLDRAIVALSALPEALKARTQLWVIGQDDVKPFIHLAKQKNICSALHFFGGRNDVPDFLLLADLLIHPAYHENTGTVLLEALVAGLPVLTVDICGYAHYVEKAKAGTVLPAPFQQQRLNESLAALLTQELSALRNNALEFANHADIYDMPEHALNVIETIGRSRHVMD